MENEELYESIKDLYCDGFEEVILDIDSRMDKKSSAIEGKIDELNKNIKELIKVIGELI